MTSSNLPTAVQPGATYRLVVHSAQEAVETIRRELGPTARVLSVRNLPATGLKGLFGRPQIEVVAELPIEPVISPTVDPVTVPTAPIGNQVEKIGALGYADPAITSSPRPERDTFVRREAQPGRLLPDLLRRGGFSDLMMARLQASPRWLEIEKRPLHEALSEVGRELRTVATAPQRRLLTDRVAFLGLAGTGRTTALSKWLAHQIFQKGRTGSVAKVEFDRPNPADGLAVFCEALGVNLTHVDGTQPLPAQPKQDFLLADLPRLRLSGEQDENLVRFLDEGRFTSRVLVLHALHDRAALQAAYSAGRAVGATHLVFTHVDELSHWGKLWDYLIEGAVTPLFLGTGPSLVGELEPEAVDALLRRTIPGA
jgi:flagellar biosynthesis protein FlhF